MQRYTRQTKQLRAMHDKKTEQTCEGQSDKKDLRV